MWKISPILLILLMLSGCTSTQNQPKKPLVELPDLPIPAQLTAVNGDGEVYLEWKINGEKDRYVLGYEIFTAEKPLIDLPVDQLPAPRAVWPPYRLDNDPNDWTHYHLKNLKNGERYYVHVRISGANQRVSLPSNEIVVIPRPEGQFKLFETASQAFSAFDFSTGKLVSSTDPNADLVFDVRKNVAVWLSPHIRKEGLRQTSIVDLKTSVEYDQLRSLPPLVFQDEGLINTDHTFIIKTQEGNVAKLHIDETGGTSPNRYVICRYTYQMLPDLTAF